MGPAVAIVMSACAGTVPMSATAADLNNDGLLDIYVANDAMENYYYENAGEGRFEGKGLQMGLAFGYVFSGLAQDMQDEMGWTRGEFSFARIPQLAMMAAASPIVGTLVIRIGAKRVLTIAILLRFMDSFMIYTEPFVLTGGGPGNTTTFLSIDLVKIALGQFDLGPAAAMSLIYFLIVLLLCWIFYTLMMRNEDQ